VEDASATVTRRNVGYPHIKPAGKLLETLLGAGVDMNECPELGNKQVALSDWYWVSKTGKPQSSSV